MNSSFVWLSILIVNSILWLIFDACGIPNGVCVFAAVAVEEAFRPVYLREVKRIVSKINRLAELNSMSLITQTEETAIALGIWLKIAQDYAAEYPMARYFWRINSVVYFWAACGFGHGISHCVALYVNLLTPTLARGTRFYDKCPQISIFFYGAYSTLSMFLLLTSTMVISFNLINLRSSYGKYLVPALRTLSSVVVSTTVSYASKCHILSFCNIEWVTFTLKYGQAEYLQRGS